MHTFWSSVLKLHVGNWENVRLLECNNYRNGENLNDGQHQSVFTDRKKEITFLNDTENEIRFLIVSE